MSWTTPITWTTGQVVTAANLNTHIRDNENFLYGDTSWTAPSYTNGWVDNITVGFRLIGTRVVFRGSMKSGTINSTAFTLPSGYRPVLSQQRFAVSSNSAFGEVLVQSSGVVNATTGSNASVWLDTVSFDTI